MGEVFARVHKVEEDVGSVKQQIAGMEVSLNTMAQTLNQIAVTVQARSSTDWKALASWAAVILAVVGMFSTLTLSPIRERVTQQELEVRAVRDERRREQQLDLQEAEQRGRLLERMDGYNERLNLLKEIEAMRQQGGRQ
jgi:uncharacterized protein YdbL (DUF1318 family)